MFTHGTIGGRSITSAAFRLIFFDLLIVRSGVDETSSRRRLQVSDFRKSLDLIPRFGA
jgi:hypothetical protein